MEDHGLDGGSIEWGGAGGQAGQAPAAGAAVSDAAQRPLAEAGMSLRATCSIKGLFRKCRAFRREFSKKEWAKEAAAQRGGGAEHDRRAQLEGGEHGRMEGARGRSAGGRRPARGRQRKPLVEPEFLVCILLPDGKVRHATSPGSAADGLIRRQRDSFLSTLEMQTSLGIIGPLNIPGNVGL